MVHLVYGASASGKSEYAENLVLKNPSENRYYLATMKVYSKEDEERVLRHKKLREGKAFVSFEKQSLTIDEQLEEALNKAHSIFLLECMSNLVANEMFLEDKIMETSYVVKKICKDLENLISRAENLVIVTNNVFEDGLDYEQSTINYMKALGQINVYLAKKADKITEVFYGLPLEIK